MKLSADDQAFLVRIGRHIDAHGDDVQTAIAALSDEDRRRMVELSAKVDDAIDAFDDAEPDLERLRSSLSSLSGVDELSDVELLRAHERLLEILLAKMALAPNRTVSEQFSPAELQAFWREAVKATLS